VESRYARPETLGPDTASTGSRNPSFPFSEILRSCGNKVTKISLAFIDKTLGQTDDSESASSEAHIAIPISGKAGANFFKHLARCALHATDLPMGFVFYDNPLLFLSERAVEIEGGADQREMGEGLRKVSERFTAAAGFLSIEAHMIGIAQHPFKE
jgi:hypothetical protein